MHEGARAKDGGLVADSTDEARSRNPDPSVLIIPDLHISSISSCCCLAKLSYGAFVKIQKITPYALSKMVGNVLTDGFRLVQGLHIPLLSHFLSRSNPIGKTGKDHE
jgi:hypothetical protein